MGNWQTGGLGTFQGASADALFGNRCVSIYLLVLFCLSPSCSKGLRARVPGSRGTRDARPPHTFSSGMNFRARNAQRSR